MAGIVVETGAGVSSCKVGDRVMANANGISTGKPHMSAFQRFVQLHESSVTLILATISLKSACVLPLACDTAMAGLFVEEVLGLSTSKLGDNDAESPAPDSVVLVWGGSSSVGCCAIRLACAAGYEVLTTASKRNFDLCESIGAKKVFDHSSESVEEEIVEATKGKSIAGTIDCIADSNTTIPTCARILAQTNGSRTIACVLTPERTEFPVDIKAKRLSIPGLRKSNKYDIVHSWMAKALANGSLQPKPDPMVAGDGLESIQPGIDILRKGVSATKIVVKL